MRSASSSVVAQRFTCGLLGRLEYDVTEGQSSFDKGSQPLDAAGPPGQEAYHQMKSVEHFTPHARMDIADWGPAG